MYILQCIKKSRRTRQLSNTSACLLYGKQMHEVDKALYFIVKVTGSRYSAML